MELVRLGDASVEAYERGMKIIKDGIASLAEYEDQRDGLGLENRRVIAGGAITDANGNAKIGITTDGEQQVQVDTLAWLGAREKKRKADSICRVREQDFAASAEAKGIRRPPAQTAKEGNKVQQLRRSRTQEVAGHRKNTCTNPQGVRLQTGPA